jgi:hypothetical protein
VVHPNLANIPNNRVGRIAGSMRRLSFWILLVLGLPQVAGAAASIDVAAEPMVAGGAAALERAGAGNSFPNGLDLRLDARLLGFAQDSPDDWSASAAEWADDDAAIYESDHDRGLSFGLEIKPRSRIGALARQGQAEDPSLGDQLQRLIENPVLGVRGRYRF